MKKFSEFLNEDFDPGIYIGDWMDSLADTFGPKPPTSKPYPRIKTKPIPREFEPNAVIPTFQDDAFNWPAGTYFDEDGNAYLPCEGCPYDPDGDCPPNYACFTCEQMGTCQPDEPGPPYQGPEILKNGMIIIDGVFVYVVYNPADGTVTVARVIGTTGTYPDWIVELPGYTFSHLDEGGNAVYIPIVPWPPAGGEPPEDDGYGVVNPLLRSDEETEEEDPLDEP